MLTSDFVCLVNKGPKVAVPIDHIVIKCCEISVGGHNLVTSLVGQSEVAK